MSDIVTIRAKGQLTLPLGVRNAAHIEEGDPLEVELTPEGILLRPKKLIDADQAWFWTPEWQAGEREASADIAAGRTQRHDSPEAFLSSLPEK
jgi:AbrB family looped-hinge helix DNA binding protein